MGFIKNFFRKRSLRRHASRVPTGILPLERIHSAVAVIDVQDPFFDACKESILSFYREYDIKGSIFFMDFRKIGNEERLITSIQTTITRKDVNWYGKPSRYKMNVLAEMAPDLFISLFNNPDFALEYMAKTCKAKFKIGRRQMGDKLFDMVISDPADKTLSQWEGFIAIRHFLERIR
jgi:hypothetical protein